MSESITTNTNIRIATREEQEQNRDSEVSHYYRDLHKEKMQVSLKLLPHHVWDDGSPIKKYRDHTRIHNRL